MCVVISYLARGYLQIEETNILKNHKDMNSRKLFKSSVLSPVICKMDNQQGPVV